MHPRLITTPYFTLHTFGVMLAAAYLTAFWWVSRAARRDELPADQIMSLSLWCIVGGMLGSKALMVIREFPSYLNNPEQLIRSSFLVSAGDFYGGFLGALVAAVAFFRKHPTLPIWRTADLFGPAIALGQAIGRIGCLMAGDDYGSATTLPWAVTFTDIDAASIGGAPLNVPLHPVQVYESLSCLALFFFLNWLARRKRFDGEIILAYALCYAVVRFLIEYLRGDEDRGFLFHGVLSTSQFIAIMVSAISAFLFIVRLNAKSRPAKSS